MGKVKDRFEPEITPILCFYGINMFICSYIFVRAKDQFLLVIINNIHVTNDTRQPQSGLSRLINRTVWITTERLIDTHKYTHTDSVTLKKETAAN